MEWHLMHTPSTSGGASKTSNATANFGNPSFQLREINMCHSGGPCEDKIEQVTIGCARGDKDIQFIINPLNLELSFEF